MSKTEQNDLKMGKNDKNCQKTGKEWATNQ